MELKELVKVAKQKGYNNKEIKELLIKKGYSSLEIEKILNTNKRVRKKPEKEYEAFDKFKMLFSEPLKFFEKVQDESIAKALILLLFILFIVSLIRIGLSFTIGGLFGGFMGGGMFILGGGLAYFIFGILGSFIYAGIIHVIVKIFGGEGNYVDTYNIFAYSSLPALVLSLIPFVGFLGGIFSMIIMIFGISFLHNVSKGKAVLIVLMPLILLFAFIFLMALVIISSFAGGF